MKIVFTVATLLLMISSFTYLLPDKRKIELKTDEEIATLLQQLSDTAAIKKKFGAITYLEYGSKYFTTTSGCYATNWFDIPYDFLKIQVIHYTMNSSKPDSTTDIRLNPGCNWSIKGHKVDSTKFSQIKKEQGIWAELNEGDSEEYSRYAKVTKYVIYYSEPMRKSFIDSLNLDPFSGKQMERYFGKQKIRQIRLSDNTVLLEHLELLR